MTHSCQFPETTGARISDSDAVFSVWGRSPHPTYLGPELFQTSFGSGDILKRLYRLSIPASQNIKISEIGNPLDTLHSLSLWVLDFWVRDAQPMQVLLV